MLAARRGVLHALFLLTTACLLAVVVIERAGRATPTALSAVFMPQDDESNHLSKVYADALKQATADDAIESAGFQLANLEPDPFAATHAKRARKAAAPAKEVAAAPKPKPAATMPAPVVTKPASSSIKTAPAAIKTAAAVAKAEPVAAAAPVFVAESDDELAAESRADSMLGAAKDLEKAARFEMESAKAKFAFARVQNHMGSAGAQAGQSILSAMSEELKKLTHLNSDNTKKEADTGSWDTLDIRTMSAEAKKLNGLLGALKGGKSPQEIASGAEATAKAQAPAEEDVKLSAKSARSDLNTFFNEMSRPEDVRAHAHDVGDTYDTFTAPQKIEKIELRMQQKKIDQLENLVLGLAESKTASAGVQRGRVGMGMQAQSVGNAAYASILQAAQHSEMQALSGSAQQQGLPGVNVGDWYNDQVEKRSEDQMLVGNRFGDRTEAAGSQYADVPGFMSSDEGGAQLASFSLPAKVKKAKCPACGFLPSCKVNPQSLGFSRATGTFGSYPSAQATGAEDAYGGGHEDGNTHPAHIATLRQLDSGGIMQSQSPLWTELSGLLPASAHTRRLLTNAQLLGSVEGGQMLASFTLAPPPKVKVAPPPKCVCPHCKLGDEQVGWEDEHHGMLAMPMGNKVDLIDEELMKLDPSYAIMRSDPNYNTYKYPFINNHAGMFAKGVANPLSDFHEDNRAYQNQVASKDKKTIW